LNAFCVKIVWSSRLRLAAIAIKIKPGDVVAALLAKTTPGVASDAGVRMPIE